jgi:hypothetical protein
MAEKKEKSVGKTKKTEPRAITFYCQRCEKYRPIAEMRMVTRFVPPLVVCEECARELR